ncbi:MAG: peptidyl-tRNA hydrolase Pth2 [Candidatus Nanoarchaeia archaeon]|nr:peptidyl-tRNA hydrolase Pth2 [Candidatus Nanoarchaeia archaeon]
MKQVIIVRSDLKLSKGKMSAQCSHASVEAVLKSDKKKVSEWQKEGMKKVVLKVNDLKELLKYNQLAKDSGLVTSLIKDAGRTEIEPGTITCVGIGPDDDVKIDAVTKNLKLV